MPRQETIVQVFVGSPGDVSEEREALELIVIELNKTWSANLGVRLDLIKWETDVRPGFGVDPQDVINRQVPDTYDVFIGVFWGRIGTATSRAESGTIEEFERAFKRHKERPESVDIQIYFKDAPISPSKIDPEQLRKLLEFKETLGSRGGLYWEFNSISDFEASLRAHLSTVAQKWAKKTGIPHLLEQSVYDTEESEVDCDEDYGFLDYLEAFDDFNSDMCSALSHLSEATNKIGENMNKRTESLTQIGDLSDKSSLSEAKKVIKLASEDMERYARTTNTQLPILSKSREGALTALSEALVVYRDFDVDLDDLLILETNLKEMREAALGAKVGLKQFQGTIQKTPRITTQYNRARKQVTRSLDKVFAELDATAQVTQNLIDSIAELKAGI